MRVKLDIHMVLVYDDLWYFYLNHD